MATRWYIIHVYSGFEKKVMHSIREQAIQQGLADELHDRGYLVVDGVDGRAHYMKVHCGDYVIGM